MIANGRTRFEIEGEREIVSSFTCPHGLGQCLHCPLALSSLLRYNCLAYTAFLFNCAEAIGFSLPMTQCQALFNSLTVLMTQQHRLDQSLYIIMLLSHISAYLHQRYRVPNEIIHDEIKTFVVRHRTTLPFPVD